ncbi:elicitor protein [Metarhizium album ARSEF 1941]|uniref:Elicitor protein n=1 Tax=Metarhizium album (strain ARSEF 1941) TaxID=1081103 RepID=A0A0B2X199_METAS|nr:elicitor protein [Metarhizium album ARSEF 1941]KHN99649.1 elicitor protein [Metarhizium album ARSEF 1941]
MSQVASQNRFAFLGNDDSGEHKPIVPVKTVDKATARTTKRNAEPQAPAAPTRGTGNRRGGPRGNEGAFRDRGAGSDRNHARPTDEAPRDGPRGGYGARLRGGRGSRRPRDNDDRHPSRSAVHSGSEKQAAQSWGANEGDAELKDEQAGEAIAQSEKKEALAEDAAGEEAAEPEDKSVSYADYLAQQAEKKLNIDGGFKVREANEGSKPDKKWAGAKALEKAEDEDFISGSHGKKQRERERKVKQTVDFDPRFVEPERTRGGGRGGRGRGGRGGERGGGGDRGRGASFRGGRGGAGPAPINTKDESAFPSLGGK